MPVADDDYKKRLAGRMRDKQKASREAAFAKSKNIPEFKKPERGIIPLPPIDRFLDRQAQGKYRERLAHMNDPKSYIFHANDAEQMPEFMPPVAGAGSVAGRIATPILQRALQAAGMEGKYVGGSILEEAAAQGVKLPHSGVARAGRAAEDELINFLEYMASKGAKPATLNRFAKGFSEYGDDPVQAMTTLGENLARNPMSGMSAKEALVQRLLQRLGSAAEDAFF